MTQAILWKEFREQGPIGLALLVLGSGVLAIAATQAAPGAESAASGDVLRFLGLGRLLTLMLSVTAGMVCGGAVFAAEREAGTMSFLESLPMTHWGLWKAKLLAGASLTLVQSAVLLVAATALGLVPTATWAAAVLLCALLAFVWGMFGSTAARTTLGSVGYAVPSAVTFAFLAAVPVVFFYHRPGTGVPRLQGGILFLLFMFAAPLLMSARLFTRNDRARKVVPDRRPQVGYPAIFWLAYRQFLQPGAVIGTFAVVLGFVLAAPESQPFVLWPAFALAAGSLTGVLAFAEEQTQGSSRFWAEQRLPLGRAWAVKIGCQFLICLGVLFLLTAPLVVRSQFSFIDVHGMSFSHAPLSGIFGTQVFDELGGEGWNYLLFGAVYGFAAGQLSGMIFRKLVVAWAVAALAGGAGAVLWLPSLLAGGVRAWQLWLPPAVVLLTGRLLLRAWTADRLFSRRPMATLMAGGLVAVLLMAVGIGYRVVEIPDPPGGDADIAYVAGLMPFDENTGGRDFKTAAERFAIAAARWTAEFDRSTAQPPPPMASKTRPQRLDERLEQVLSTGWAKADPNLEAWLDKVFENPAGADEPGWQSLVDSALGRPLGIYDHPQVLSPTGGVMISLDAAKRMSWALLARGLLRQVRGEPADFVHAFRAVMLLARSMRNGSLLICLAMGNEIERYALWALDRWLERLTPRDVWSTRLKEVRALTGAAVLQGAGRVQLRAIAELAKTVEETDSRKPFDPLPQYLAERHLIREALRAPTQSLPSQLGIPADSMGPTDPVVDLIAVAWAVPWEKERTRRLAGSGLESGTRLESAISGRPGKIYLMPRSRGPADLIAVETLLRAHRRASLLKLGLTAYRLEVGVYPETLDALVPAGYLQRLPSDPFDDSRGFGYRISSGETLRALSRMPGERLMATPVDPPAEREVPAGQAIVWSLGSGKTDQGGINPPTPFNILSGRPGEVVFLVPLGKDK